MSSSTACDYGQQVRLDSVKAGEFIRRTPHASKTYTRGEYDRTERKYMCNDEADISRSIYLKGATLVWVGFTY